VNHLINVTPHSGPPPTYHIFIDNITTLNLAEAKWTAKSNKALAAALLSAVTTLKKLAYVQFFWVPGHAKIPGNETADWLSKRGAAGITSLDAPPRQVMLKCLGLASDSESDSDDDQSIPHTKELETKRRAPAGPNPPQEQPSSSTPRRSSRIRADPPLVSGIDFSMCRPKRPRTQSPDAPPRSCPHGMFYNYSHVNPTVDLVSAALQCHQCDNLQREAIDLPASEFDICDDYDLPLHAFDL
jgi:hypothetical protein